MTKKQCWTLPLVFLLGYIVAWGSILIDRQMVIIEQEALKRDLKRIRQELQLHKMVENFRFDWQEMIIWNKEALQEPTALEKGEGK